MYTLCIKKVYIGILHNHSYPPRKCPISPPSWRFWVDSMICSSFSLVQDMLARSLEGKYLNSLEKKQDTLKSKDCLVALYSNPKILHIGQIFLPLPRYSATVAMPNSRTFIDDSAKWWWPSPPVSLGFCVRIFFGEITISVTKSRRKNTWDMFTIDFLFIHVPLCL